MKILIVEDNRELSDIMQSSLFAERYVVEVAYDYTSASQKLAAYEYDCILLDVMLPDGSGLELLAELKAAGKRESSPDSIKPKSGKAQQALAYFYKHGPICKSRKRRKWAIEINFIAYFCHFTYGDKPIFGLF